MKTALITGATAGIGRATARLLAANGWRVIGTGRRQERLDALREELGSDKFLGLAFDITDDAARDAAIDGLPGDWRGIDLLVNNAGLAKGLNPAQEADLGHLHALRQALHQASHGGPGASILEPPDGGNAGGRGAACASDRSS